MIGQRKEKRWKSRSLFEEDKEVNKEMNQTFLDNKTTSNACASGMERGSLRNYSMNVLFRSEAFKSIMELSKVAHPPLVVIYLPKKRQNSITKFNKKFTKWFPRGHEKIIRLMELASPGF